MRINGNLQVKKKELSIKKNVLTFGILSDIILVKEVPVLYVFMQT